VTDIELREGVAVGQIVLVNAESLANLQALAASQERRLSAIRELAQRMPHEMYCDYWGRVSADGKWTRRQGDLPCTCIHGKFLSLAGGGE
jgi:hypothetical protein